MGDRPKRREHVTKDLCDLHLPIKSLKFWDATLLTDEIIVNNTEFWGGPGAASCFHSHLSAMTDHWRQNKENNWNDHLILFEDDVWCLPNVTKVFEWIDRDVPDDWEFIYL